ncbi:hypothetical protein, partial [Pseudomonas helleri]|uniref:hypothetical protein n=1 Tax=Pseudomonas helleri TaxID=1608996 RepID=UPI003FCEF50E
MPHRDSAKCRSYEFKWCFYINSPGFMRFLRTKKVIYVPSFAPIKTRNSVGASLPSDVFKRS